MNAPKEWLKQRLQKIIVATDFEKSSRTALGYASGLAKLFRSQLSVLNVFQFGPYSQTVEALDNVPSMERRNAEEMLQDFVSQSGTAGGEAKQMVVEGTVPSEIIKTLFASQANLLVIGTRGVHRGVNHFLLGSNSETLMLGSPCPTLTIGPNVPESLEPEVACKKVLYISDFSIASTAAATFANNLGRVFGAETEVYQIAPNVTRFETLKLQDKSAQYADMLRFSDPDLPPEWYSPAFHISRVFAETEVLRRIADRSNLIVLGVQPASFLQRHLHTSLAYRVITDAASPVLSIPARTRVHGEPGTRFAAA